MHERDDRSRSYPAPSLRRRLYCQLEPSAWPRQGLSPLNLFVFGAIVVATLAAIVQTEPALGRGHRRLFDALELGFGVIFLAEYLGRLWIAPEHEPARAPAAARLRFAVAPLAILDLATVVFALIPFLGINALLFRVTRLFRIMRVAKLGRLSTAMRHLLDTLRQRRHELILTVMMMCVALLFGAAALYWLEGDLQPAGFGSIPRALWWAVETLTTLGYGDIYPVTLGGRIVAAMLVFSGVGLVAMQTGILAAAFSDALQRTHEHRQKLTVASSEKEQTRDRPV